MNFKAHDYPKVYEDLGIDLSMLGCIMLEVKTTKAFDDLVTNTVGELNQYFARDSKSSWINGIVVDEAHVTLLYGLTRTGQELKKHVDTVLDGKIPASVTINNIGYFDSPYGNEEYYCIVAHLDITPELQEAHERLTMLPHIKTFPGYKAHVTLAYIKKDEVLRDQIVAELNEELAGATLPTGEIDYGGNR